MDSIERPVEGHLRPIGLAEGEFVIPDEFDKPLPEEILRDFEGIAPGIETPGDRSSRNTRHPRPQTTHP